MSNTVTNAERAEILVYALTITELDEERRVLNFKATTGKVMAKFGCSHSRAESAVAKAARIQRNIIRKFLIANAGSMIIAPPKESE